MATILFLIFAAFCCGRAGRKRRIKHQLSGHAAHFISRSLSICRERTDVGARSGYGSAVARSFSTLCHHCEALACFHFFAVSHCAITHERINFDRLLLAHAATGDIEVLTGTQATTLIDTFTSALKGLAPASGGGTANFLRADGSWVDPTSSVPDIKSGADTVALDGTTTVTFNTAFSTAPNVVLNFSGNVDYAASEKGINLSVYNITVNGFTVRYDQFDGTEDPANFQWIATSAGDP